MQHSKGRGIGCVRRHSGVGRPSQGTENIGYREELRRVPEQLQIAGHFLGKFLLASQQVRVYFIC